MIWLASFSNSKKPVSFSGRVARLGRARSRAVTLIELIVALAIIFVLLAISLGLYAAFRPQNDLAADARNLEGVFRLARSNALASKEASAFGVHLEAGQAVLFPGDTYNPLEPENIVWEVGPRNEISAITLAGGGAEVIFERLEGATDQFGSITLRALSSGDTQTLYVDATGAVGTLAPAPIGESGLVRDARHVHFTLGWSIQNATFIQFFFPEAGTTESVDMSPFFNAGKTDFDWNGSFLVGGSTEEFRVHTHSLDAFDTILSITRDRSQGQNTKEVEVRILDGVAKVIVTYNADGTAVVGNFGGEMLIQ